MTYYFAYGSNMNTKQMLQRTPTAIRVGTALLPDHRLAFNRLGTTRTGGVASIVYSPGQLVYGVVWRLSFNDLDELDKAEDVPLAYTRRTAGLRLLEGGAELTCSIYEAIPQGNFAPDLAYLKIIVEGASEANLPVDYIKHLIQIAVDAGLPLESIGSLRLLFEKEATKATDS